MLVFLSSLALYVRIVQSLCFQASFEHAREGKVMATFSNIQHRVKLIEIVVHTYATISMVKLHRCCQGTLTETEGIVQLNSCTRKTKLGKEVYCTKLSF
jgi:hypothetical protein